MTSIVGRYLVFFLCKVIAGIALIIITLFAVLNLLEGLGDQHLGLGGLLVDVALQLPEIIYLVLPATCAVGAVIGMALLDTRGEIVLLRTMGVSAARLIRWLLIAASVWVIVHAVIGEFLLTTSAAAARKIESQRTGSFISSGQDIWLRTNSGFASVGLITPDSSILRHVWLFTTPGTADLSRVVYARQAILHDDYWLLEEMKVATMHAGSWEFSSQANEPWLEGPSVELLQALAIEPRYLPITRLLEVMEELGELGQNTLAFELVIWSRIIDSLTIFVFVFAGMLAVHNRPTRYAGSPRMAGAVALLVMFFYYYGTVVVRRATLDGNWPAFVGALVPPVVFVLAAIACLKLMQRNHN